MQRCRAGMEGEGLLLTEEDWRKTKSLDQIFLEACREVLFQNQTFLAEYCRNHAEMLSDDLYGVLRQAVRKLHGCQEKGEKGSLVYLQFSFLMSGLFSSENLLKIDFYDERFYADPCEIECYWDYSLLFPKQQEQIETMMACVRKGSIKVRDYEILERLPLYRLGQMRLLQNVMTELSGNEKILSLLAAEGEIQVLYGTYMGEFRKLRSIKKERL